MNHDSSLMMQVAVTMLPRLNTLACLPLLEKCGGIEGFFTETETAISALYQDFNIKPGTFDRELAKQKAVKEIVDMDRHGISLCSVEHHTYPYLLRQCEDAPIAFFYKGKLETEETRYLAIVGTRKASERCKGQVEIVVKELCGMGHHPVIVSGLAFGIDAAAHNASLKHHLKTYAVLGHGLHMIYPASHKNLSEKILSEGGALISEYPVCAAIHQGNFLQRNRIIAGLSHATLIAESAARGGAMATGRLALSYDREVMAFPGRPEDKMSSGCNHLIKQNIAALTENGTDVAKILGLDYEKQQNIQTSLDLFDTGDNEVLATRILTEKNGLNIDELSILCKISVNELSSILLKMELEGKLMALPGKRYILC